MSNELVKEQHSKRIHAKKVKAKRQARIAKQFGIEVKEEHIYHKVHALNCGDPKCFMCGNPRKFFKELTIQEKRFYQKELEMERGQDGNAADC